MDWQYFATLIGLFTLLDLTAYVIKRGEQAEHRKWWNNYDAESARRHNEFMAAVAEDRRERRAGKGGS